MLEVFTPTIRLCRRVQVVQHPRLYPHHLAQTHSPKSLARGILQKKNEHFIRTLRNVNHLGLLMRRREDKFKLIIMGRLLFVPVSINCYLTKVVLCLLDEPRTDQGSSMVPESNLHGALNYLATKLRTVAQSEPPSTLSGSRSDNPHHNQFIHVPPANRPLPTSEQGKASMTPSQRSKLLPPIETRLIRPNDATSRQYTPPNQIPATATLPGPKFQAPAINSCLHTGLDPNMLLSPILQPFPGAVQPPNITANERNDTSLQPNRHPDHYLPKSPQATNSPQNSPDTNSKRLEHLLDAALETALTTALIIQTSGGSAEILSPRAHNTLQMLNALVSAETPVSSPNDMASNPHTRFKSVRNVASWLRIPRSPK